MEGTVEPQELADDFAALAPVLQCVAKSLCATSSEADDLVQDTFERALKRHASFDGVNLRGWLVTVMRNLFLDRCRREARRPRMNPLDDDPIAPAHESEPSWACLEVSDIEAALAGMSPKLADVYRLRAFANLRYQEIADKLSIPIDTVSSRLGRARRRLRELLVAEMKSRGADR